MCVIIFCFLRARGIVDLWLIGESRYTADERKIKIQARFESLSGKEAKKVMEKKQKKIAQREKKSRPFAPGQTGSTRRSSTEAGDGPYHRKKKRRD